jgi:hypothetical protein
VVWRPLFILASRVAPRRGLPRASHRQGCGGCCPIDRSTAAPCSASVPALGVWSDHPVDVVAGVIHDVVQLADDGIERPVPLKPGGRSRPALLPSTLELSQALHTRQYQAALGGRPQTLVPDKLQNLSSVGVLFGTRR